MVKAGYKQTEIGVIPEDWEIKTIGDIADVKTGPFGSALHERDYVEDGTPIITVEHLGERGVEYVNLPMVSDEDLYRLRAYSLQENDVVFSRVGSIDRNALISKEEAGWLFSGRLLRVRLQGNTNYAPYLSYHFHSEPFKQRVRNVAVGQTMPSLNTQILNGIQVILPTAIEQRAIAEALSDVDALIAALDKLIAKKRAIKTAAMQELLTGKKRLPGFGVGQGYKMTEVGVIPEDWEIVRLESLSNFVGSGKSSSGEQDGRFPIYGSTGRIGYCTSPEYEGDSILVARVGANAGRINLVSGKYGATDNTIIVKLTDAVDLQFIYSQLLSKNLNSLVFGSGQPLITGTQLKSLSIIFPSLLEQQAIAEVLSDIDAEITALETRRDKTQALKQGMMQELLTGRTRLV